MKILIAGQKVKLSDLTSDMTLVVGVHTAFSPPVIVDIACFGVDEAEQLVDDRYMIFFNQKSSPCGTLTILSAQGQDKETFNVKLTGLPTHIKKLIFTASINGTQTMAQLTQGYLRIAANGQNIARFDFDGRQFNQEKAILIGSLYFKDQWRLGAIGQGFNGGLSALLAHFGGEEIDAPSSTVNATSTPISAPTPPSQSALPPSSVPGMDDKTEGDKYAQPNTQILDNLIFLELQKFKSDKYYVAPNIPQKKINNATISYSIPQDESIAALVDATVFGSAKSGLVFGYRGVYWANDWTTKTAKNNLSWSEIIDNFDQILISKDNLFLAENCPLNLVGSSVKPPQLYSLFKSIAQTITRGYYEQLIASKPAKENIFIEGLRTISSAFLEHQYFSAAELLAKGTNPNALQNASGKRSGFFVFPDIPIKYSSAARKRNGIADQELIVAISCLSINDENSDFFLVTDKGLYSNVVSCGGFNNHIEHINWEMLVYEMEVVEFTQSIFHGVELSSNKKLVLERKGAILIPFGKPLVMGLVSYIRCPLENRMQFANDFLQSILAKRPSLETLKQEAAAKSREYSQTQNISTERNGTSNAQETAIRKKLASGPFAILRQSKSDALFSKLSTTVSSKAISIKIDRFIDGSDNPNASGHDRAITAYQTILYLCIKSFRSIVVNKYMIKQFSSDIASIEVMSAVLGLSMIANESKGMTTQQCKSVALESIKELMVDSMAHNVVDIAYSYFDRVAVNDIGEILELLSFRLMSSTLLGKTLSEDEWKHAMLRFLGDERAGVALELLGEILMTEFKTELENKTRNFL